MKKWFKIESGLAFSPRYLNCHPQVSRKKELLKILLIKTKDEHI